MNSFTVPNQPVGRFSIWKPALVSWCRGVHRSNRPALFRGPGAPLVGSLCGWTLAATGAVGVPDGVLLGALNTCTED